MITTSEIAPSPPLAPFVRCYSYREFDTKGQNMEKPWHAPQEITMVFFFDSKPVKLVDHQTKKIVKEGTYCDITGLATHYLGMATLNGNYSMLEICFRPNGFHKIFGVSIHDITNHIIAATDILDINVTYLFEQLCFAKTLAERVTLTNVYLLNNLKRQKFVNNKDPITLISNFMFKNINPIKIAQMAYSANMCTRNFERHFLDEVGMSPKRFSCVVRFNHAFQLKLRYPQKDWTSIAPECGYFDQTHLIKDFKRYSGNCPSAFLKQTPLTEQQYIGGTID